MTKNEWISVKDRLPPPDAGEVWAYFGEGEPMVVEVWQRHGVTRGFCHHSFGAFSTVTHWTELVPPDPPEDQ